MGKNKKSIFFSFCVAATCVVILAGCNINSSEKKVENIVTPESQTIRLTGVSNARQLGGYITIDGKRIKDSVLLRTARLSNATKEDSTRLTDKYDLTTVIDLRSIAEIEGAPDIEIDGVTEENIRIINEKNPEYLKAITEVSTEDLVGDAITRVEDGQINDMRYSNMVIDPYSQKAFHNFFEILLTNEDGAILFHCSAGKDRTGVAAVLLLSALDVDKETIMDDFLLTNDFYAEQIDYMVNETKKRTDDPKIIEGVQAQIGVDSSYMEKMFDTIDEEYGSMDVFLKEGIGLTDKDILTLKDRYLE